MVQAKCPLHSIMGNCSLVCVGRCSCCVPRDTVSQAGHVWLAQGGCTVVGPDSGGSPPAHIGARLCLSGLRICNDSAVDCFAAAQHSDVWPASGCHNKGPQSSGTVQEPFGSDLTCRQLPAGTIFGHGCWSFLIGNCNPVPWAAFKLFYVSMKRICLQEVVEAEAGVVEVVAEAGAEAEADDVQVSASLKLHEQSSPHPCPICFTRKSLKGFCHKRLMPIC